MVMPDRTEIKTVVYFYLVINHSRIGDGALIGVRLGLVKNVEPYTISGYHSKC